MKIGNSDSPQPLVSTTPSRAPADNKAAAAPAAASVGTDASAQVALSSAAASLLQSTVGTTAANADFNAEKVAQVSAAIEAGTFKPNPEAIADKLIANAQELLNKTSS
ncbi:MAG: flagellar biosynthesis anti-sigma factor FlgM [Burkholderiales bacterium]